MGSCISCNVFRRLVRIAVAFAALLFVAYLVAGGGWLAYHFLRDYVGIVHAVLNPTILENATPSAKSYASSLKTSVTVVDTNPAVVACMIRNVGRRSIRQVTVQVNLRDGNGNILTWHQGPVDPWILSRGGRDYAGREPYLSAVEQL